MYFSSFIRRIIKIFIHRVKRIELKCLSLGGMKDLVELFANHDSRPRSRQGISQPGRRQELAEVLDVLEDLGLNEEAEINKINYICIFYISDIFVPVWGEGIYTYICICIYIYIYIYIPHT